MKSTKERRPVFSRSDFERKAPILFQSKRSENRSGRRTNQNEAAQNKQLERLFQNGLNFLNRSKKRTNWNEEANLEQLTRNLNGAIIAKIGA